MLSAPWMACPCARRIDFNWAHSAPPSVSLRAFTHITWSNDEFDLLAGGKKAAERSSAAFMVSRELSNASFLVAFVGGA